MNLSISSKTTFEKYAKTIYSSRADIAGCTYYPYNSDNILIAIKRAPGAIYEYDLYFRGTVSRILETKAEVFLNSQDFADQIEALEVSAGNVFVIDPVENLVIAELTNHIINYVFEYYPRKKLYGEILALNSENELVFLHSQRIALELSIIDSIDSYGIESHKKTMTGVKFFSSFFVALCDLAPLEESQYTEILWKIDPKGGPEFQEKQRITRYKKLASRYKLPAEKQEEPTIPYAEFIAKDFKGKNGVIQWGTYFPPADVKFARVKNGELFVFLQNELTYCPIQVKEFIKYTLQRDIDVTYYYNKGNTVLTESYIKEKK